MTTFVLRLAALAFTAVVLLAPTASPLQAQSTITVTTDDDERNTDGDCSLREAVAAANSNSSVDGCTAGSEDGDTIEFSSTAFVADQTITLTMGELSLTDDVTIDGDASTAGSDLVAITIDGDNNSRIFNVDVDESIGSEDEVSFMTLELTNGDSSDNSSDPDAGGAVDIKSGDSVTFTDVDVTNSTAGLNGGGIHAAGNTTLTVTTSDGGTSTISGNEAEGGDAGMGGGGVWGAGATTISGDVTIEDNTASGESGSGGGVLNFGGTLDIMDATIQNNTANRAGGGIENFDGDDDGDHTITVTNATITGNSVDEDANPGNGGGLHSGGGTVEVTGGLINENVAVEGGGLWTSGTLTLSDGATVSADTATGDAADDGGGGIYNMGGDVTLSGDATSITGNVASGESGSGGGILNNGGILTVENAALIGNAANRAGGGIEDAGGSDDDDTDVTLTDATLNDNLIGENANPGNGGGLHSDGGDVEITGGTVNGNTAVEGGGLWTSGALTVSGSTVDGNEATGDDGPGPGRSDGGGGIYLQGGNSSGTITSDASVTNNTASGESGSGGGILNNGGALTVTDSEVSGNAANRAGGGIEDGGGTVTLTNATVDANTIGTANPGNGGGLHSGGGDVTISGGQFMNNTAVEGGGLWTNGTIIVQDSLTVADNEATGDAANQGGGGLYVHVGGSATLDSASVEGNVASGESGSGGGILVSDNSTVTLLGGAISDNMANRAGGGLEVADSDTTDGPASITLMRVTVRGDSTSMEDANPGNGGGIHIGGAGEATISRSTFSANYAEEGGGLWASGSSTLDVSGSTVSGNRAGGNTGGGGGVYDNGGAAITITSSTVARNSALSEGGGLRSTGGSFAFGNTIVADNNSGREGPNCVGEFTSNDYNLIADASDCTINGDTGNNITGQDAMLAVLAYNGGPTRTHRPMEDSPAIDAGSNLGGSDVDQRGFERTIDTDDNTNVDDGTDIGSVEFGADDTPIEDGPDALEGDFRLSKAYPNPTMGATRFELAVGRTQHVTARAYDVLGRRVATLHDGVLSSGGSKQLRLQAGELAAGVYVVRVTGESFRATRKVTVTR